MDLLPYLLPLDTGLAVDSLTMDGERHRVLVELQAIASSCPCPSCQTSATRIHSHYSRTVADIPWANLVVRLHLHVRTFFCDNAACLRKIFTERIPVLVEPSARRTVRFAQQQQQMGLELGGTASTPAGALERRLPQRHDALAGDHGTWLHRQARHGF